MPPSSYSVFKFRNPFFILLIMMVSIFGSCKTPSRYDSDAKNIRSFDSIQVAMIKDLKALATPDESGIPPAAEMSTIDSLVQQLDSSTPGALKLKIDGQILTLDGRPSDTKAIYKDFFTALDRAVAGIAGGSPGGVSKTKHSSFGTTLEILIKAQRKGDLDLGKSALKREKSNKLLIEKLDADPSSSSPQKESKPSKSEMVMIDTGVYFTNHRKAYIVNSLLSMLAPKVQPDLGPVSPVVRQEPSECQKRRTLAAPSIIPFKRGDLDRLCAANVRKYLSLGFRRIALFPPVHFSGSQFLKKGPKAISPFMVDLGGLDKPVWGQDFRFETLNAPTTDEIERCVSLILGAGLELSYLPHVESIVTMNAKGEAEWRISLAFSLDNPEYYELAYGPLVRALQKANHQTIRPVTVSLAGEIDNVLLGYPDTGLSLVNRLRKELKIDSSKIKFEWNPNGDFYSVNDLNSVFSQRGIEGCKMLKDLLTTKIDTIAPSFYDSYFNIAPLVPQVSGTSLKDYLEKTAKIALKIPPTLDATKELYLVRLEMFLNSQCPGLGSVVTRKFENGFGIGEFSLQGPRQNHYGNFLEGALKSQNGNHHRVNFWTNGESIFDPLVPFTPTRVQASRPPGPLPEEQIKKFLECR